MRHFFFLLSFIFSSSLVAQTLNDAVLFGQNQRSGNARFTAMGGSFGALGANTSGITVNPAGLGVYRRGEFGASFVYSNQGLKTNHYGNSEHESLSDGSLSNLSLVYSNKIHQSDWNNFNVAFVYNRRNNFDYGYLIKGNNLESSKLDRYLYDILKEPIYVEDINDYFPFGAGLAWGSQLIDTVDGQYFHALESYGHEQKLESKINGGVSDYFVSGGANYDDKLYLGASLGLSSLQYNLSSTYTESPLATNDNTQVKNWSETTSLDISGRGLNIKLGMIYWLSEKMRIGLSYASGTSYLISENYSKNLVANWKDGSQTFANSPKGFNQYSFVSPYSVTASYALVDKYIGSLNFDAELVTYGRMKFERAAGYTIDLSSVNENISENTGPAVNLRLGGEFMLGSVLLRGGANFYGNPIKGKEYFNRYSLSAGLGYRVKRMVFDFSYSFLKSINTETNIHFAEGIRLQPSTVQLVSHQFILSAGFKFKKLDE